MTDPIDLETAGAAGVHKYVIAPSTVCSLSRDALIGVPLAMDERGFVYVFGMPVFRFIADKNVIQFFDRDKRRMSQRGYQYVTVKISDLSNLQRMFVIDDNLPPPEMRDNSKPTPGRTVGLDTKRINP